MTSVADWPSVEDLAVVAGEVRSRFPELSADAVAQAAAAVLNARATLRAAGIAGADDIDAMNSCIGDRLDEIVKAIRAMIPRADK